MARSKLLSNTKSAKRRRKRLLIYVSIGLFVLIILVALGSYISKHERFAINDFVVSGVDGDLRKNIEKVAESYSNGSYIFLFDKSNKWLYPEQVLHESVLGKFKEVRKVNVSRVGSDIAVRVKKRKPYALLCHGVSEDSSDCHFLDREGFIFTEAPVFSDNVYIKYFETSTSSEAVGRHVWNSSKNFVEMDFFVRGLESMGFEVFGVSRDENGDFEVSLSTDARIIVSDRNDMSGTLVNLQTLLNKEKIGIDKEEKTFEYIDLRFGNKIYYKPVDEEEKERVGEGVE